MQIFYSDIYFFLFLFDLHYWNLEAPHQSSMCEARGAIARDPQWLNDFTRRILSRNQSCCSAKWVAPPCGSISKVLLKNLKKKKKNPMNHPHDHRHSRQAWSSRSPAEDRLISLLLVWFLHLTKQRNLPLLDREQKLFYYSKDFISSISSLSSPHFIYFWKIKWQP